MSDQYDWKWKTDSIYFEQLVWLDLFCPLLITINKILTYILILVLQDMTPCSPMCRHHHFEGACCLHVGHSPRRVSTLKMKVASSSKMLVPICLSTQYGITEDCNLVYMKYFSFFHRLFYGTWIMTFCLDQTEYVRFFIQPVTWNYKILSDSEKLLYPEI